MTSRLTEGESNPIATLEPRRTARTPIARGQFRVDQIRELRDDLERSLMFILGHELSRADAPRV